MTRACCFVWRFFFLNNNFTTSNIHSVLTLIRLSAQIRARREQDKFRCLSWLRTCYTVVRTHAHHLEKTRQKNLGRINISGFEEDRGTHRDPEHHLLFQRKIKVSITHLNVLHRTVLCVGGPGVRSSLIRVGATRPQH